jgi:hypothetical protein
MGTAHEHSSHSAAKLTFFGTPLVIEPSPGQLSGDAGLPPLRPFDLRLRRFIAEPLPALAPPAEMAAPAARQPGEGASPAAGADVPAEARTGAARRRHFRRRQRDPLGEGQPCTWRTLLIQVAAEIVVRTRRIAVQLSSIWPHLDWYRRVCERLRDPLAIPVPHPSG